MFFHTMYSTYTQIIQQSSSTNCLLAEHSGNILRAAAPLAHKRGRQPCRICMRTGVHHSYSQLDYVASGSMWAPLLDALLCAGLISSLHFQPGQALSLRSEPSRQFGAKREPCVIRRPSPANWRLDLCFRLQSGLQSGELAWKQRSDNVCVVVVDVGCSCG